MGIVGVTNVKSGEYAFFSTPVICWPLTYGILYTVEIVLY